jgi:hypothetical protein
MAGAIDDRLPLRIDPCERPRVGLSCDPDPSVGVSLA